MANDYMIPRNAWHNCDIENNVLVGTFRAGAEQIADKWIGKVIYYNDEAYELTSFNYELTNILLDDGEVYEEPLAVFNTDNGHQVVVCADDCHWMWGTI